ncbi:hypothetical protein SLEP1_g22927 [Rubroshorea leprosula]|uniref:Nodulin-related protein 1 n=1 Tax=Rubroshorea leprosula TaxID=152421 RepID=A0AAV5JJY5_9ROSI|nr:hypothetical protein SLEP1_g22927 [Rubroshorea leprosula]
MDSYDKPSAHPPKHHQSSSSELFASAKLVAEAAQATLRHESDKVDRVKVAGAAEDLLGAASHYGKLEEKGLGKYVQKAEDYLHQYHTSQATPPTVGATSTHHASSHSATTAHSSGGDGHSGSGYGDYLKMAEGFLGHQSSSHSATTADSSGSEGHSGSGYGDYFKMAEGFLKKH